MRNLLLALALSFIGTAQAAVNLVQVSEGVQGFECSNVQGYQNVPGLSVDMRTNGRPVVVTISTLANVTVGSIAELRPVVDGQVQDDFFSSENNGDNQGRFITLHFSRAYTVPQGLHTFTAQINCPGSGQVLLSRRWMTVMEID